MRSLPGVQSRRMFLALWFLKYRVRHTAPCARAKTSAQRCPKTWARRPVSVIKKRAPLRRTIVRADGGWEGSTMYGYLTHGDAATYRLKFRVERPTLEYLTHLLSGHLRDNHCHNSKRLHTGAFKVACCMYFLAHGHGDMNVVADVASIGRATLNVWLDKFCDGCLSVLRPIFMPATPPSVEHLESVRSEFAARRCVSVYFCTYT